MQRFDGRIAVVTGASSGIGRRLALDLAARGATVVGLARRQELLAPLEVSLADRSPGSSTLVCDVADEAAYRSALATVEERHGRIDILVNNAGVNQIVSARQGSVPVVREVFDVNFFAVVNGTFTVAPGMVDRRWGIIVNVSSDSARAPE